jgi:hypothetical protein
MANPETLTKIEYTRHKKKTKTTTQKSKKVKKISNTDATKNRALTQVLANGKQSLPPTRHPSCYSIVKMCGTPPYGNY